MMAAAANNATVVLVEPQESRRTKALQLGARVALDPTADDFADVVADVTKGRGFDVVVEATGSPVAMASALELGGHESRIVYVGINIGAKVPAQLGLIQSKALRIRGMIGSAGQWRRRSERHGHRTLPPCRGAGRARRRAQYVHEHQGSHRDGRVSAHRNVDLAICPDVCHYTTTRERTGT